MLDKEKEGEVSSISSVNLCSMGICQIQTKGRNKGRVEVSHRLYNQLRGLVKAPPFKHPVVDEKTRLCGDRYGAAGGSLPG